MHPDAINRVSTVHEQPGKTRNWQKVFFIPFYYPAHPCNYLVFVFQLLTGMNQNLLQTLCKDDPEEKCEELTLSKNCYT